MSVAGSPTSEVSRPLWLLAELTYACPLQCPYCSNPVDFALHKNELDTETWSRRNGYVAFGDLEGDFKEREAQVLGASVDSEFLWIVDPLDGTTNFAHSYPFFGIALALFLPVAWTKARPALEGNDTTGAALPRTILITGGTGSFGQAFVR